MSEIVRKGTADGTLIQKVRIRRRSLNTTHKFNVDIGIMEIYRHEKDQISVADGACQWETIVTGSPLRHCDLEVLF